MLRRIVTAVTVLVVAAIAAGQTLVVYPFESADQFLGTAVADRVALALEDELEVYGPVVAPSLVPPLPVGTGFLNITDFLQGRGVASRTGSALLRGALGTDLVLTGTVELSGDTLTATGYLAGVAGVEEFRVSSPVDDPAQLVRRIAAATAAEAGVPFTADPRSLDLSSEDGQLAQVLTLLAAGLVEDARRILADMVILPGDRASELLEAIRVAEAGGEFGDPALLAALAINDPRLDEELALRYFDRLARERGIPAAELWTAVLHASLGDVETAQAIMAELPAEYAFGVAALAAFQSGREGVLDVPAQVLDSDDPAALLALAAVANGRADPEVEKEILMRLGRAAPFFTYPFERLSFIAFDQDDALAAAQALVVAVQLEPESDLYWTNLGWAYYLLGFLERSEQASVRAVELNPDQYIGLYNLGLARVVTGRLAEGLEAYRAALRIDPEVDDAAVEDLENALRLYPGVPAVHYALGLLYEAEGRRADAAAQFSRFLRLGGDDGYGDDAQERVERLTAPPPPIELTNGIVSVGLGPRHLGAPPFHPGDPLYPRFEVYTPGDELPDSLDVTVELVAPDGSVILTRNAQIDVPSNAIGYVVGDLEVRLPEDLADGTYRIDVRVEGEEREANGSVHFTVSGRPEIVRQLLARNLTMEGLNNGRRLYGTEHLTRPEVVLPALVEELRATAEAARQALPELEGGRFAGMDGGEAFENSSEEDVADFLRYLVESGAREQSFVFVEAYAQWLVEGTPTEPAE